MYSKFNRLRKRWYRLTKNLNLRLVDLHVKCVGNAPDEKQDLSFLVKISTQVGSLSLLDWLELSGWDEFRNLRSIELRSWDSVFADYENQKVPNTVWELRYDFHVDPKWISSLRNLRVLEFHVDYPTDISHLVELTNLHTLKFSVFERSVGVITGLESLSQLQSLRILDLSGSDMADFGWVRGLVKLRVLDLSGSHFSDLTPILGLVNLNFLNISFTDIRDVLPLKKLQKSMHIILDESWLEESWLEDVFMRKAIKSSITLQTR
jgi:hypothetical protein